MGGTSAEREVSLVTGGAIEAALKRKGYKTKAIEVGDQIIPQLLKLDSDLVFIAMHGCPGEDGTVQAALDLLGIPYVGSGVLASALGMDKIRSKIFFAAMGIPSPFYVSVSSKEVENEGLPAILERLLDALGLPMIIKPTNFGSAIGVKLVKSRNELLSALEESLADAPQIIAEEYIKGTEITVSVLGNTNPITLPIIEIVSENDFYDYEAKYDGKSKHIIPARISEEAAEHARRYALAAHLGFGCRGLSRSDFIVSSKDQLPYILEINTIPGMTPTSLFPEAAKAAGIQFEDLMEKLVDLTFQEKPEKS